MANVWARSNRIGNINKLLKILQEHKELNFKQLKEGLGVSDPTLTEYIKDLERQNKIEHFDKPEDRRSQWYRINTENSEQVKAQLLKYQATQFIEGIQNPVVASKKKGKAQISLFATANEEPEELKEELSGLVELLAQVASGFEVAKGQKMAITITLDGTKPVKVTQCAPT